MNSTFVTHLEIEKKVDWTVVVEDLKTGQFKFFKEFKSNDSLDLKIDPFKEFDLKYYLVVYKHQNPKPGKNYNFFY
jgi:hypothetical protein